MHQRCGHEFALGENILFVGLGELTLVGKRAKMAERTCEHFESAGAGLVSGIKFVDHGRIFLFQPVDSVLGAIHVVAVQIVGNLNQGIGGSRHGREHNNINAARTHQCGYFLYALCTSHRSASEFQYFQGSVYVYMCGLRIGL